MKTEDDLFNVLRRLPIQEVSVVAFNMEGGRAAKKKYIAESGWTWQDFIVEDRKYRTMKMAEEERVKKIQHDQYLEQLKDSGLIDLRTFT